MNFWEYLDKNGEGLFFFVLAALIFFVLPLCAMLLKP